MVQCDTSLWTTLKQCHTDCFPPTIGVRGNCGCLKPQQWENNQCDTTSRQQGHWLDEHHHWHHHIESQSCSQNYQPMIKPSATLDKITVLPIFLLFNTSLLLSIYLLFKSTFQVLLWYTRVLAPLFDPPDQCSFHHTPILLPDFHALLRIPICR